MDWALHLVVLPGTDDLLRLIDEVLEKGTKECVSDERDVIAVAELVCSSHIQQRHSYLKRMIELFTVIYTWLGQDLSEQNKHQKVSVIRG